MQERDPGKAAGSTPSPAKRGRPFGSTTTGVATSSASAGSDSAASASLLGHSLQVSRIALALESGLRSQLTWDLNMLMLLSFKEKDDPHRDATPLAKISGLLDALFQVADFGNEYETLSWTDALFSPGLGSGPSNTKASSCKKQQSVE